MTTQDRKAAAAPTPRVRVRREPHRAAYERAVINAVLDAGFMCCVGYAIDSQPYVTPTSYWRRDDLLYWHGSSASRMLRHLERGAPVCVTVTHLDGLVLARSAFNHAMNYRSVMILGKARLLEHDEKEPALQALMERFYPGRWREIRRPTCQELTATTILSISLDEASAKIRCAPPIVQPVDTDVTCWSGVIPLGVFAGPPVGEAQGDSAPPVPDYATTVNERFAMSLPYPLEQSS